MLGIFPLPWTPPVSPPFLQEWEGAAQFHRQGGMPPCMSRAGRVQEKPVPMQEEPWGLCSWGACPQQWHGAALSPFALGKGGKC